MINATSKTEAGPITLIYAIFYSHKTVIYEYN